MCRALAPVAPGGRALEPLRRTAQRAGTNVAPAAASAPTAAMGDVSVVQQFFGPTTSGGRLQEINWNVRYAPPSRRETIGGVARSADKAVTGARRFGRTASASRGRRTEPAAGVAPRLSPTSREPP